jgi:hypothetical protein
VFIAVKRPPHASTYSLNTDPFSGTVVSVFFAASADTDKSAEGIQALLVIAACFPFPACRALVLTASGGVHGGKPEKGEQREVLHRRSFVGVFLYRVSGTYTGLRLG